MLWYAFIRKMKGSLLFIAFFISSQILMAQSSVLSEGTWFKVGITETGIYKIDRTTLDLLGIPESVNPRKIKIYGNGVLGILPQENAAPRPADLVENAIFLQGESDGSFDQNDYILFYGLGPDKEEWTEEGFAYEKNIYSDTSFYFIRIDGANGKRVEQKENAVGSPSVIVDSFADHIVFEEDENNIIASGRGWYGERLNSGDSKSFSHQINGLNSTIQLVLSAVSQSVAGGSFTVSDGSGNIGAVNIDPVPDGPGTDYSEKAYLEMDTMSIPMNSTLNLRIEFDGNGSGERGFIDFYALTFERNLRLYNSETHFRWNKNIGELIQYEIKNSNNAVIWDVTDPTNIKEQENDQNGDEVLFNSQSDEVESYVVFSGSDFPTPFMIGAINNQNLRGNTNYDGIIISHPQFLSEAHRLAQFHQTHDGLNIRVASTQEVYNEFSSGRQDISAIRDYAKYMYDAGGQLKYLLLFGDCSYDYKDRISGNSNFVPTYESRRSFHPIFSYSSDDYYGFLEDDEGEWLESLAGDHTMEIGVGRLPVKTLVEAQTVVDKIIYYATSSKTLGKWKNEITYVSDDGDNNVHVEHVEKLSALIDTTYAQYKINKVLLDAFTQSASGSSEKSPQANAALKTRIKEGTFVVNYIGHGNERLWTEEEVLTRADIDALTNRNKLPIFVTATCEFGRYDNPITVSGAERLLLNKSGGGIALLTTSRPVFASTNFSLNEAFHQNIFRKEANENLRLGDVIRLTKNEGLEGAVNRNFTLLGDPMMMPAYPKIDIVINESGDELDTLSALEEIKFSGQIESNGSLQVDFNGTLIVNVLDVSQSFITKGQQSTPYSYQLRTNAIFRGEATVTDGMFNVSFIVPKNISYQFEKGKISLYAWDEDNNVDAAGSSRELLIGGTAADVEPDEVPPSIRAYLNDDSFNNGDVVGDSPLFIAKLEDENGITTTRSGVVQGITLTIGEESFNLNDFYTADADTYQQGTVVYPLQDLAAGRYSATLQVWDTHNNASESTIEFVVTDQPKMFVYNPIAYPNPVRGSTVFAFEHDREDEDLRVSLQVHSSAGDVVSLGKFIFENSERTIEIPWEANTNSGEKLRQGIYFARLNIKSELDGATKEIVQRLVIVDY